jgi:cell wall-associated NlpC family hydrolase
MKLAVVGGMCGAILVALILGCAAVAGSAAPIAASFSANVCVTTGPIDGLSGVASTNARTVAAAAEQAAGPEGALIAVLVGYTESGLRILGNPAVDTNGLPTHGVGTNYDSIGIFQQRASWGNAAQRLDPVTSTVLFIARLKQVAKWEALPPWVAAQEVQRSAFDGHPRADNHYSDVYGGNYAANVALARRVVAQVDRDAQRHACGALTGGLPANTAPGSHGLPDSYTIPRLATPAEARVVAFAIAQLDKPYVFGAAGPEAFDCSGLVTAAWARVGVQLPHSSSAQAQVGSETTPDALAPGDLVLVPGDDGTLAAPGHVGLYIGKDLVLNAADERDGIRVQTYANFLHVGHGLAGLRHIA